MTDWDVELEVQISNLEKPGVSSWTKRFFDPKRLVSLDSRPSAERALHALLAWGEALASARRNQELFLRGLEVVLAACGASRGAVLLFGADRARHVCVASGALEEGAAPLLIDRALLDFLLDTGLSVACPVGPEAARWQLAGVPLFTSDKPRAQGALCFARDAGEPAFEEADLELAALLGGQLMGALEARRRKGQGEGARQATRLGRLVDLRRPPRRRVEARLQGARQRPPVVVSAPSARSPDEETRTSAVRVRALRRRGGSLSHFGDGTAGATRVPLTLETVFGGPVKLPDYLEDEG